MNNNNFKTSLEDSDLELGQSVMGVVDSFSTMGANIIFNEDQKGLLYKQEVYPSLKVGEELKFYIKQIRQDGKIDLTLNQAEYKNFIDDTVEVVMNELRKHGGFLPFNDKSSPDAIRENFQMSKKKFKETLGKLYKDRQITIEGDGIYIVNSLD